MYLNMDKNQRRDIDKFTINKMPQYQANSKNNQIKIMIQTSIKLKTHNIL